MKTHQLREHHLEKTFISAAKLRGGVATKLCDETSPTLLVTYFGGIVHMLELKNHNGQVSDIKARKQRLFKAQGIKVYNLFGLSDVQSYFTMLDNKLSREDIKNKAIVA